MMNYNHLYYFHITAKLGGVSNASKYLNISQPSLSSQLKIFEAAINQSLFKKEGRRLQLTPDGERAYHYTKKIFDLTLEFSDSLRTPSDKENQKIRIGITDQVERSFIADLLSPLIQAQQLGVNKTFFISSAPTDILISQLRTKEIDLLLTNKPIYEDDLKELAAANMPVNLLVSNKLLKDSKIRISRNTSPVEFLNNSPFGLIIPSYKLKLRHETDIFFQDAKIRKKVVLESDVLSVIGRALVDGAGIGFMPAPYVYEEIKSGALAALGPNAGCWQHGLYLLGRKDFTADETIEELKIRIKKMERLKLKN